MANSIETYLTILSTRAVKEISASWEWYEERQIGLGDKFSKDVTKRLQQIEANPERYPCNYRSYRSIIIDIFPFLIIYKVSKKKKQIRVVSVFHTKRNPKKKFG